MKTFAANCPSCGGPIEFRISESLVTVCDYCRSAIARTNRKLEDQGKVAELFATRSPLELGTTGKFRGRTFEIVGRVQYQHPAGGVWDEWYLAMPGGTMGWLAEAQGRFYLLFRKPARILKRSVTFESLDVGDRFDLGSGASKVMVSEKGTATAAAAEGEIPWRFTPRTPHRFADFTGQNRVFGTIEFGEKPGQSRRDLEGSSSDVESATNSESAVALSVFLGREVSLEELGITAQADEGKGVRRTTAVTVNCPNCGGPLNLIAPDRTERVGCPNCKALLDCDKGNLKFFAKPVAKPVKPLIPLGTTGHIDGVDWTVIGFMERYVVYEATKYRWTEYLLYRPQGGFRWLVNSERHWNFVTPIPPGEVDTLDGEIAWNGRRFRLFQKGIANVSYVVGEFYWQVQVGETADTRDYVDPPLMLSIEGSGVYGSNELNASIARYMRHEEVEEAFGAKDLPRSFSVAPNQPAPPLGAVMGLWAAFSGILMLLYIIAAGQLFTPAPDGWLLAYALMIVAFPPGCALIHRQSFEMQRWANSDYSPYLTGDDDDE